LCVFRRTGHFAGVPKRRKAAGEVSSGFSTAQTRRPELEKFFWTSRGGGGKIQPMDGVGKENETRGDPTAGSISPRIEKFPTNPGLGKAVNDF
jgi:hypothetical protein